MKRFLPRVFLATALLGGVGWVLLARTAAALKREQATLVIQARQLAETGEKLAGEIGGEEKARVAMTEKVARSDGIRRAIQTIASLPSVPPVKPPASLPPLPPPPKGPRDNAMFAELLDDPEYARLCTTALLQDVEERYGAILFRLRAEPAKQASLTRLLVERRLVVIEADHLALLQKIPDSQQLESFLSARDRLEAEIRTLVGDDFYAQLK
ncbi:MAG: hypothetical protein QM760_18575 [Nibricoccus sp.]